MNPAVVISGDGEHQQTEAHQSERIGEHHATLEELKTWQGEVKEQLDGLEGSVRNLLDRPIPEVSTIPTETMATAQEALRRVEALETKLETAVEEEVGNLTEPEKETPPPEKENPAKEPTTPKKTTNILQRALRRLR